DTPADEKSRRLTAPIHDPGRREFPLPLSGSGATIEGHFHQCRCRVRSPFGALPGRQAMAAAGSVSHWLDRLQAGDHAAAQPLWEVYFQRLVALARARLQGVPRQAADAEDVALSAFDSFCRGVAAGRFPQLADRADLWRLL